MTSKTAPGKRSRRGPVVLQLIVVLAIAAAVVSSFSLNVMTPAGRAGVPEKLGDLELNNTVSGSEALRQVERLHGTGIELTDAYVAGYRLGARQATVWVGTAPSPSDAIYLAERMITAIEEGGSGFGDLRRLLVSDHPVFQVDGPGGEHFFYISGRTGDSVVWLTVTGPDAIDILRETLANF